VLCLIRMRVNVRHGGSECEIRDQGFGDLRLADNSPFTPVAGLDVLSV
jgi:hypothetical protein